MRPSVHLRRAGIFEATPAGWRQGRIFVRYGYVFFANIIKRKKETKR